MASPSSQDPLSLPPEIRARILEFLGYTTKVLCLPLVCKNWKQVLAQPSEVWKVVSVPESSSRAAFWLSQRKAGVVRLKIQSYNFTLSDPDGLIAFRQYNSLYSTRSSKITDAGVPFAPHVLETAQEMPDLQCLWLERRGDQKIRLHWVLENISRIKLLRSLRLELDEAELADLVWLRHLRMRALALRELQLFVYQKNDSSRPDPSSTGASDALPLKAIAELTSLTSLSIRTSSNFCRSLEDFAIHPCTLQGLKELNISSYFQLNAGECISTFTSLHTLRLDGSRVLVTGTLPRNLRCLYLQNISFLGGVGFRDGLRACTGLRVLHLSDRDFSQARYEEDELHPALARMRELESLSLYCSESLLTRMPALGHLTRLTFLAIPARCLIEGDLPPGRYLKSLRCLIIDGDSRAHLAIVPPPTVAVPFALFRAPQLRTLALGKHTHGRLSGSDFQVLCSMPRLREVYYDSAEYRPEYGLEEWSDVQARLSDLRIRLCKPCEWVAPSMWDPSTAFEPLEGLRSLECTEAARIARRTSGRRHWPDQ